MNAAFNDQIKAEMFSSNLYLSMVAYFEEIGLKGFANWMRIQVQEENAHGISKNRLKKKQIVLKFAKN